MCGYQNIAHEIEAIEYLNRFLVVNVYDRVAAIDVRIRSCMVAMAESGIPIEACNEFKESHYEKNQQLFKGIYTSINEMHIPAIRMYLENLARQYYAATGSNLDIGNIIRYPDSSQNVNATASLMARNSTVNDYALQCDALCDFADFLVKQTEQLDYVLQGYGNCCNGLLDCGVPQQIYNHYVVNFAEPMSRVINNALRVAMVDDHKYLLNVYHQISSDMNELGIAVTRTPDAMPSGGNYSIQNNRQIFEQNYKDIENALGIKQGPKMSIAEADKQNTNPHYNPFLDNEYGINCATCAITYALRVQGFDVTAKGNIKERKNLNYWLSFGNNTFRVWKNQDGTPVKPTYIENWMDKKYKSYMTPKDFVEFFEDVCDTEGVYVLTLDWKKEIGGGGHATILQHDKDGLHWIEPQVYEKDMCDTDGRRKISELATQLDPIMPEGWGILRVDDKIFDVEEKSFKINEGIFINRMGEFCPEPLELLSEGGDNNDSNVIKMSFAKLVEVNNK